MPKPQPISNTRNVSQPLTAQQASDLRASVTLWYEDPSLGYLLTRGKSTVISFVEWIIMNGIEPNKLTVHDIINFYLREDQDVHQIHAHMFLKSYYQKLIELGEVDNSLFDQIPYLSPKVIKRNLVPGSNSISYNEHTIHARKYLKGLGYILVPMIPRNRDATNNSGLNGSETNIPDKKTRSLVALVAHQSVQDLTKPSITSFSRALVPHNSNRNTQEIRDSQETFTLPDVFDIQNMSGNTSDVQDTQVSVQQEVTLQRLIALAGVTSNTADGLARLLERVERIEAVLSSDTINVTPVVDRTVADITPTPSTIPHKKSYENLVKSHVLSAETMLILREYCFFPEAEIKKIEKWFKNKP